MTDPIKPDPTKPETAAQHSGSADVSYGVNTNLSPGDVSEAEAVQTIVEGHQTSGAQSGDDPSQPQGEADDDRNPPDGSARP
jgi:hypothetical protein